MSEARTHLHPLFSLFIFTCMTFTKKRLHKDVWLITEPWFAEHANLYVVRGSQKTILIDAGIGLENLSQWLNAQQVMPDSVVTTHGHFDHCGGLQHFDSEQIFLTPEQMSVVQNSELWGLRYLKAEDVSPEKRDAVRSYQPVAPKGTQPLPQVIDLGNYQLRVFRVGGHTNDSILLYEASCGWLFTGDLLYNGVLYTDLPNTSLELWQNAITLIKKLNPKIVFPGHNEVLKGSVLHNVIARVEERLSL